MVKPKPLQTTVLWVARLSLSGATIAWMALIFYLSSLSQAEVSQPLESPVISWLGVLRSYAAHIVLYGILAFLAQVSLWAWKPDYRIRWALVAAAFSALYGISDEYHQSLIGRSGSIADVIVNVFGATIAVAGLWIVGSRCRRITKRLGHSLPHNSTG